MWTVIVKDRGRNLAVHQVERRDEAEELRSMYHRLGYAPDRVVLERPEERPRAA